MPAGQRDTSPRSSACKKVLIATSHKLGAIGELNRQKNQLGAGHNGMICAGYLAKCGQKIMVVEKNMEVGGGLDSHEDRDYPGFWHNIHSVFHRGLMMLPWYKDLELGKPDEPRLPLNGEAKILLTLINLLPRFYDVGPDGLAKHYAEADESFGKALKAVGLAK